MLCLAARTWSLILPAPEQLALNPEGGEWQSSVTPERKIPKNIAIVGSGITGTAAASRLYEGFRASNPLEEQPTIIVFECNPVVGGRITQAYVFNDPLNPIDTCAATFAAGDTCVATLAANVGLTLQQQAPQRPRQAFGVWNGKEMLAVEENFRDTISWSEYRQDKWSSRWGDAPVSLYSYVKNILRLNFDTVLGGSVGSDFRPFVPGKGNLSEEVERSRLTEYVKSFKCTQADPPRPFYRPEGRTFGVEIINAGARERFFSNGWQLNVLGFSLGFEDEVPSLVRGGNLRLVERLLKLSTTDVRLESEVQKIEIREESFELTSVSNGGIPQMETFDMVVLATSLSLANITFEPKLPDRPGLEQFYEDSFVTHFTSYDRLNSSFFNRTGTMPQNILTTEFETQDYEAPFFSLTLLNRYADNNGNLNNLYKLVSREGIPRGEIERYLIRPLGTSPLR